MTERLWRQCPSDVRDLPGALTGRRAMRKMLLSMAFFLPFAAAAAAEEIVCSEYCAVVYTVARGAPLTYMLRGRETP